MKKPNVKIIIYTALFGGYDQLLDPCTVQEGFEYVCFSDRPRPNVAIWDVRVQPPEQKTLVRAARHRKIMPHLYLDSDATFSLWVDSNIQFHGVNVVSLIQTYLNGYDMALFNHAERICVYEEAKAVLALRKEFPSVVHRQMSAYKLVGYPANNGLCETGVLLRRHTRGLKRFNEAWWAELEMYSHRDQLSFNYTSWKTGIGYGVLPGSARANRCPWLTYRNHG